jgi:hypothetical protein
VWASAKEKAALPGSLVVLILLELNECELLVGEWQKTRIGLLF